MEQHLNKQEVQVNVKPELSLAAILTIPVDAQGIVLFAHGTGSSRHSPRNQFVARFLNEARLATLLLDLLTPDEEEVDTRSHRLRFDIEMLATRLVGAIDWLTHQNDTRPLNIGLFGASTGAGAALVAAAHRSSLVSAIVSRGGRPDLAGETLKRVIAPTLLIVGGNDQAVIEINQQAQRYLNAPNRLEIIAGASHLFEEPDILETVASLAQKWFSKYLME